MKEHAFELLLENNPLRAWVREKMEVAPLRTATPAGCIRHALHIACGNGSATELIRKYFAPQHVSAVDRDEALIAAAGRTHHSSVVDFSVQDVRSLSFENNTFDAAFDLADLHNFADWRRGVAELSRVLRVGGLLIMEEISAETFSHASGKMFRMLTEHPYESMLTMPELKNCILGNGFDLLRFEEKNPLRLFKYFLIVARKRV